MFTAITAVFTFSFDVLIVTLTKQTPTGQLRNSSSSSSSADSGNSRANHLTLNSIPPGHYVEYCQDQHGSRFIQQQIELANAEDNQMLFKELLPAAHVLMEDRFGNYIIQKFFDFGSDEQKLALLQKLQGHVLSLSTHTYGCRVMQKAIEMSPSAHQVS